MSEIRHCASGTCGKPYIAERARSKYCSVKCRTAATRARQRGEVESAPDAPATSNAGLVSVVERVLVEADRLDTVAGQMAVQLAKSASTPGATPSAVAAATRELRAVMDEALRGVAVASDPLDEVKARRDAKLTAATG